jgi:nitrite reductase/ring-hydroxylating ferredoxin subunit
MESEKIETQAQPYRAKSSSRIGQISRRRFLVAAWRGFVVSAIVLVIDQMLRFLSFEPSGDEATVIPLGLPGDYARGSLVYVEVARAYVGHDEQGYFALDAVCPHLGCLVELGKKEGFKCPCHGSRFDAEGQPKTGPATAALRYLYLWLEQDGQLMVDRDTAVEASTRLKI